MLGVDLTATWTASRVPGAASSRRAIADAQQARELADQLQTSLIEAVMVEFVGDDGLALAIGVGAEAVPITYQRTLDPPYFISEGTSDAEGEACFLFSGEPTFYAARNLVPRTTALLVLDQFVADPWTLPSGCQWESL